MVLCTDEQFILTAAISIFGEDRARSESGEYKLINSRDKLNWLARCTMNFRTISCCINGTLFLDNGTLFFYLFIFFLLRMNFYTCLWFMFFFFFKTPSRDACLVGFN